MLILLKKIRFFYLPALASCLVAIALFTGCNKKNSVEQNETIFQFETEAQTTISKSKTPPDGVQYQAAPEKVINNSKTEIILNESELTNTKIIYSSLERKMTVQGHINILSSSQDKITEKTFSLTGQHTKTENIFILAEEENSHDNNSAEIKAVANCLGTSDADSIDCHDVVIDIYILYKNKYYSEQIELKNMKLPVGTAATPQPNSEALQREDEDQISVQQSEDTDGSIDGRFQGEAETINLETLFAKESSPDSSVTKSTPAKRLSPELAQTSDGSVRPINQAFGLPNQGWLRSATSILTRQLALNKNAYFEVVAPDNKKHFATYEMAELITRIGAQLNRQYTKKIYVSNLSGLKGGLLSPHVSHQNGLDADLGYPTDLPNIKFPLIVRMNTNEYFQKNYSIEKTYQLFKYIFQQKDILADRIFVDKKIKKSLCDYALAQGEFKTEEKSFTKYMFENIQHVNGHGDHFHLRIKCSKFDSACRNRIYKKMDSCGQ